MKHTRPGPFAINVRDISRKTGEMREFERIVTLTEKWGEGIVSIPAGSEVDLDVRLESVHEGILATVQVDTEFEGECSRCLTDIREGVEVEVQELFAYSSDEATDFEVQDDHVDLEIPVRDAIVLSLPFQPVCQPDCPGLDPATGEKLTVSQADRAEVPIDPRWAALQELTDQASAPEQVDTRNTEES